MTAPLVTVDNLHRSFQGRLRLRRLARLRWEREPPIEPLRGVHFTVDPGEWLAIIGANGVGKTTILKVIAGLLRPHTGRVLVNELDVAREEGRTRALVGYALADERSFYWRLTVRQNLVFFSGLEGLTGAAARERIEMLLRRMDLLEQADLPFAALSTGMKQRLTLARALLSRPRVLLLDEPTRSLDANHAADVWAVVREEVQSANGCVVLVTHQLQDAVSQSDRVVTLHDGVIAMETTAASLRESARDSSGLIVTVQGLPRPALAALRAFAGVRDIRVASSNGNEQVLEVWTENGSLPLSDFITELTDAGATISALQQGTPMQAVLERLTTHRREAVSP